jgi:hypothetical protein
VRIICPPTSKSPKPSRASCTRLDKIRNVVIRKELGVFSTNDRIRGYRQDWLETVERLEEGRVPEQVLWNGPKGRRDPGR